MLRFILLMGKEGSAWVVTADRRQEGMKQRTFYLKKGAYTKGY